MKKSPLYRFILIFYTLSLPSAFAQSDTLQDGAHHDWKEIKNQSFKLVYPDLLRSEGQRSFNLLNFYQEKVGNSFGQAAGPYTVILRPDMAIPNGFVTLMPKRSEWFSHGALTPSTGAMEWLQGLAIHEYRHMVQFDYFKRANVSIGYALFGEMGQALLMANSAPDWFFEGDAVWAETALSEGGRGRSARFSARLKALAKYANLPSYDQWRGGVYNTSLPNHYVWGHYLISKAREKFGEDIWAKIIDKAVRSAYNPYTFYNAFESLTGEDFAHFYQALLDDFEREWGEKESKSLTRSNKLYTEIEYPLFDNGKLYYLKKDLDSFWALYEKTFEKTSKEKKITNLNLAPSLSKIDIKKGKLIYAQINPDKRYSLKTYSDLFLFDLKKNKQSRLTRHGRFYHPSLHPSKELIASVSLTAKHEFVLAIIDFNGKVQRELNVKDGLITEAVWGKDDLLYALVENFRGEKFLARIDLKLNSLTHLTQPSRRNLYALRFFDNELIFEADDKNTVNAFSYQIENDSLKRLSNEPIAAFRPIKNDKLFVYVKEAKEGKELVVVENQTIKPEIVLNKKKFFNQNPSSEIYPIEKSVTSDDQYIAFDSQKNIATDYHELERSFTPHSWSLIGDQGLGLHVMAQNPLNTLSATAALGIDAIDERPYAELSLLYKKWYPILGLSMAHRDRSTQLNWGQNETTDHWVDMHLNASAVLPYVFQRHLYQGRHELGAQLGSLHLKNVEDNDPLALNKSFFTKTLSLNSSYLKMQRSREIQPSWGVTSDLYYTDIEAVQESSLSSYLGSARLQFFTPGLFLNHGMKFVFSGEYRKNPQTSYRGYSPLSFQNEYVFSRGYQYAYVDKWHKASFNYALPITYNNFKLGRWVYFPRIYANLFYDHTQILERLQLNSWGGELFFETLSLRKIPITYGLRVIQREHETRQIGEGFVQLNVSF